MKSIMHNKQEHTCYLCSLLCGDDSVKENLHEHHVIHGWANRRLSEKYGLKVYLCIYHHEIGSEAVHNNAELNRLLKENAQRAFEKRWPGEKFAKIFGKSYTDESVGEGVAGGATEGFRPIAGMNGMGERWDEAFPS